MPPHRTTSSFPGLISTARQRIPPLPPVALVLISVCSVQFGQAVGKTLFDNASPAGVVTMRLVLAAILVGIVVRPGRPASLREAALAAAFGAAIAGMNIIYLALQYLPLGVATTIQLLGPLSVAIAISRRRIDTAWALLAASGLALFAAPSLAGGAPLHPAGIALALVSAVSMGSYVLLSQKAGAAAADHRHVSWALMWASVLWAPFGTITDGSALVQPEVLGMGLLVAILSAALPYSLELAALRNLSARIVGTLQSLEPALGSLAGSIVLGELLTITQLGAVACVTAASIAAVSATTRHHASLPAALDRS